MISHDILWIKKKRLICFCMYVVCFCMYVVAVRAQASAWATGLILLKFSRKNLYFRPEENHSTTTNIWLTPTELNGLFPLDLKHVKWQHSSSSVFKSFYHTNFQIGRLLYVSPLSSPPPPTTIHSWLYEMFHLYIPKSSKFNRRLSSK